MNAKLKQHFRERVDVDRFWEERNKSREALDKERASASFAEKIKITEQLRKDALFLKTGKVVGPIIVPPKRLGSWQSKKVGQNLMS